jgi:hypothetical protein
MYSFYEMCKLNKPLPIEIEEEIEINRLLHQAGVPSWPEKIFKSLANFIHSRAVAWKNTPSSQDRQRSRVLKTV